MSLERDPPKKQDTSEVLEKQDEALAIAFKNASPVYARKGAALGKGAFGEVYQYEVEGGHQVAVKFPLMSPDARMKFGKVLHAVESEIFNNTQLAAKISKRPDQDREKYKFSIVISIPIMLIDEKKYGLMSPIALCDLNNLLAQLGGNSEKIVEPKILLALQKNPIKFMTVIAEKMRACILAKHELNFLHLDVAARNFLVYGFEFNNDGTLQDIDIRITDLGRALEIPTRYESVDMPKSNHPVRYLNHQAFNEKKSNIMSDIYALKVTLITMVGILLQGDTGITLSINEYYPDQAMEDNSEFIRLRTPLSDIRTLELFYDNAKGLAAAVISQITYESRKKIALSEEYNFKLDLAQSCIEFLDIFSRYLFQNYSTNLVNAMTEDNEAWDKTLKGKVKVVEMETGSDELQPNSGIEEQDYSSDEQDYSSDEEQVYPRIGTAQVVDTPEEYEEDLSIGTSLQDDSDTKLVELINETSLDDLPPTRSATNDIQPPTPSVNKNSVFSKDHPIHSDKSEDKPKPNTGKKH